MVLLDKTVMVVDDEPAMGQLLKTLFTREQAEVYTALTGEEGLRQFYERRPHMVIIDFILPGIDGLELCQRIRQLSDVPIIILTAYGDYQQAVASLDAGADDFVTKPFKGEELLARARAVLRRVENGALMPGAEIYDDGHLLIDLRRRLVSVAGQSVKLTPTEYDLLTFLLRNAGRVCTFGQILDNVWGGKYQSGTENIHVFIWHLRQKIEEDPKQPRYLISEHSVGYRFVRPRQK